MVLHLVTNGNTDYFMATLTCKIPEELNALLEKKAEKEHVPKSAILREALVAHLKKNNLSKKSSAFDLVRHLSGSLQGPSDLATDPKHLKSLGA